MKNYWMILLLLALFSCKRDKSPVPTPLSSENSKVAKAGEQRAMVLLKALKKELQGALEKKGSVGAIEFCSLKALPMTEEIQKQMKGGVDVKRTSEKYRNPKNAPNEDEQKALTYFSIQLKEKGKLPSHYIQKVQKNKKLVYNYYKPLKMEGFCLTCHGASSGLDKKLIEELGKRYPQDKATGYKDGDFRGVVRVSMPADLIK